MPIPRSTVLLLAAALLSTGCDKVSPPGMGATETTTTAPPSTPATTAPAPEVAASPQPAAASPQPAATLPSGHPPIGSVSGQAGDPTLASFVGLQGPKPESWEAYSPTSTMRAANYRVPGEAGEAEVVVFYFGQGMGGTAQANIDRWAGQFSTPDGGAVEPVVSETTVDGMAVTHVELAGDYRGMGTVATPDQLFLAAIVEAPAGNTYIRLVGPRATVEDNRGAFEDLVSGLKKQ